MGIKFDKDFYLYNGVDGSATFEKNKDTGRFTFAGGYDEDRRKIDKIFSGLSEFDTVAVMGQMDKLGKEGDLDFFYISDRTSLLSLLCGGGDVGDKFNKKSEVKIEKSQRVFQIRNLLFPVVCI